MPISTGRGWRLTALQKLADSAEPAELSGTLIIVPLINVPSFAQKVPHVNPVDGKNMNRFYPGEPDGTQTERVSWAVAKQVIEKCDYLIDLHGGDLDENLRRYSYWAATGKEGQDATVAHFHGRYCLVPCRNHRGHKAQTTRPRTGGVAAVVSIRD